VVRLQFSVLPGVPGQDTVPVVIWRNPRIRFRRLTRRRDEPQPLAAVLSTEDAKAFAFGQHPTGASVGPQDFVTKGAATRSFDVEVAEGVRGAELLVEAQLDLANSQDCVVRCEISGGDKEKKLASISAALLANPQGEAFASWKVGVLEFARLLPQVSHREAAPADRDPIPPPFDNTYNMPERNFFHAKVKYHRDDQFLVEELLDDTARKELDQAWTDLLTSFEYHDILLRFVAEKYNVDLHGQTIANVDELSISQFPAEQREYVRNLRAQYASMQQALRSAETRHVDDVLTFAARAWRRPLTDDEKSRLRSFYAALRTDAQLSHTDATRTLLARTLVAPEFLYRLEKSTSQEPRVALSDWELATRLSYFLWSSLPDEELTRAAATGVLHEPQQLARQASRMLADPKARRLATEYFGQWLGFYQFDRHRGVDPQRFPEFTDKLKSALYDEAIAFFENIVRENRPVGEILFADYAFLDRDLAQHYGIQADVSAAAPTRIDGVNRFHRGGLTGLGAVLTVTSAPLRTSPVKRGDWVLRRVLGTPVPPPPADAGSIAADDVAATGPRTVRERLDAHRRDPACTNCHSRIDPLGFTLEHYDPIGRWREAYRDGATIDASGVFADGKTINGPDGLRQYLKSQEPQFHRTLCTKLLGYALGRGELLGDQPLLEEMTAGLATSEGRFSDLIKKIVTSPQFRYHRGQSDAQ
jgi:hypothetical protein